MKVIKTFDVILAYIFIVIFAAALVAGVFMWPFFILAGVMLAAYFVWNALKLRCPWCGASLELDRLLYARRHDFHCQSCGHEITVVDRID